MYMILKKTLNSIKVLIYNSFKLILRFFKFFRISLPDNRRHNIIIRKLFDFAIKTFPFFNIFFSDLKNLKFYSQFMKEGDYCFDIGTNIGEKTRIYLQLGAKVICVEPQKDCIKILRDLYGKNKNVIIVDKAVGKKEEIGELFICNESNRLSTFSKKFRTKVRFPNVLGGYHWSKKVDITITTLDSLIKSYGVPKFCKIDVEGYEIEVFEGLTKKIPFICFEFHLDLFNDLKKCINHLLSLGEAKFNFVIKQIPEFYLSNWVSPNILYKTLISIGSESLVGDIYVKFI